MNAYNSQDKLEDKYRAALQGAIVVAKICQVLSNPKHGQDKSDAPISFNELAQLAAKQPEIFNAEFNVDQVSIDSHGTVIMKNFLKQVINF